MRHLYSQPRHRAGRHRAPAVRRHRRRNPVRTALATAVLSALGLVGPALSPPTAGPNTLAAAHPGGRTVASGPRTVDGTVPAPPAPPRVKPAARVPALGGNGSGTVPVRAAATSVSGKAVGSGTAKTLVLYDSTGPYAWLGEVYGIQIANLSSHFGAWTAHPVTGYTAGEQFDFSSVAQVNYKGAALTRDATNGAGIMDDVVSDPTKATVLATAQRADSTTFPWAVRSGTFTYVGEIPFAYVTHDDRYLAFADLLFDALAPGTAVRHRALVRIEDVGPDADPTGLKAVTDYLYSKHVPFTVAVYPRYRDPKGYYSGGVPQDYTLAGRPAVVSALKYMQSHGGTLLMHGYTHQYSNVPNPYDAVSADDFEFYRAHIDAANNVVYDTPVAEDSTTWATGRLDSATLALMAAGFAKPTMFEFPHYAGSVVDYRAVASRFTTRYDRGLYFPGQFSGAAPDYTRIVGQFFPYTVRDVYGTAVVPENLGNVEPEWFNNHPPRLPADILASAQRNLVLRDGTASFFYHPYLGTSYLKTIVTGIQGMGYTFVTAQADLAS